MGLQFQRQGDCQAEISNWQQRKSELSGDQKIFCWK